MSLENLLKKGKKFIKRALIAGLVSSSLFLTSCPGPSPKPSPNPDEKNELADNTQVLPEQDILKITALYDNEINLSEPISYLSSGDVIVGDISDVTPNGFLRKVEYISGDGRTIYTKSSNLEEALKNADFEFQGTLSPTNIQSLTAKKGVSIQSLPSINFNINLDNVVLYDFDENPDTTYDQIIANGNISFSSDFYLKFKIGDWNLKQLTFKNITNEDSWLEISALNNLENIDKKIKIAEFYLHPFIAGYIPTTPPFPIIITPKLEVNVGMNGNISPIQTSVTQGATLTAGLAYENGSWSIIKEFENSFSGVPPSLPEISYFKSYAGPRLNFLVYGIAGPYAELNGYLKLDAQQSPWKLYGGLEALLGVNMKIFSKTIADYSTKVINFEKLLVEGEIEEQGSLVQLTFGPLSNRNPDWSPDGNRIAFYSNINNGVNIMNLDGSGKKNISPDNAWDWDPDWSPDGSKIVFTSAGTVVGDIVVDEGICVMDSNGSNRKNLTNNIRDNSPEWSPDGSKIVFVNGENYGISVINSDGNSKKDLTNPSEGKHYNPTWSPDRSKIIFYSDEEFWVRKIYIMDSDGNNLKKIADAGSGEPEISFSPDGSKILFSSYVGYNNIDIYIMNLDGTNKMNLTNYPSRDYDASFSPDGRKIIFVSDRSGSEQIYRMVLP